MSTKQTFFGGFRRILSAQGSKCVQSSIDESGLKSLDLNKFLPSKFTRLEKWWFSIQSQYLVRGSSRFVPPLRIKLCARQSAMLESSVNCPTQHHFIVNGQIELLTRQQIELPAPNHVRHRLKRISGPGGAITRKWF